MQNLAKLRSCHNCRRLYSSLLRPGSPVCFLSAQLYISSTTSLGAESDKRWMTVPPLIALDRVPAILELISSSSAATAAIELEDKLPPSARSPPHDMASLTGMRGGLHTHYLPHSPITRLQRMSSVLQRPVARLCTSC